MIHRRTCHCLMLTAVTLSLTAVLAGCSRPSPAPTPTPQPPATQNQPAPTVDPAAHTSATSGSATGNREPVTATAPATKSAPAPAPENPAPPLKPLVAAPLDLSLSTRDDAVLFDKNFDANGQDPYRKLFDLRPHQQERRFSVGGDLFWDEEKLKQQQVNYLDALKGGEISIEVKTP